MSDRKNMYVGNLPWGTDENELRQKFEKFGEVHTVKMITDRETQKFRGFAFVEMDTADADSATTALHESDFGGRPMIVNEARPKQPRSSGGGHQGGDRGDNRGNRSNGEPNPYVSGNW